MWSTALTNPDSESAELESPTHRLAESPSIAGSAGMSYRPLLELGEGGMARIVLALATGPGGFNKLVVLKVMRTGQDNTEIRRLLLAEARLSARLNHPNVVQVQEVVHATDLPYLVMEYLDGQPLSALRALDLLTPGMLMTVISEVLVGLQHAHELSDFDGSPLHIVHRDVSPHNVFVTYDGVVKVLDFGIAKTQQDNANTETGEVKGKIAYMPPEQLLGEDVDRRADIFAVGGMLWEVATGTRMWANISQANLMHRLMTGDIPRPSSVAAVDPELERIIMKATAADRVERYETALDMRHDLDAYLDHSGQRAVLRDVGAILAEAFKSQRQARARSIKEALRHNSVPPAVAPQLDLVTRSEAKLVKAPPRRTLQIALGLVALLLGGLGVATLLPRTAPVSNVAAPASSSISVTVHAAPAEAQIRIDGETYAQPSVSLVRPRDARPHTIEVFADGFVSDTRSVAFRESLTFEVSLRAVEAAKPEPSASADGGGHVRAPPVFKGSPKLRVTPGNSAGATADCTPPYFFDHGIKTYKPQCL